MKEKLLTKDVTPRIGEIIKPAEMIAISGMESWTLADRRTWNLLLVNAWGDRLEDPTADFSIPLRELRGLHDSNDRLRDSLERLQKTLVSAPLPNGRRRTVQMLGGTDIDDDDRTEGVLVYDFHRKLVPLLRRSEIYARMEIKVMSAFTSKYSLALYEAIAARIEMRKSSEEISLETLRVWLGVEAGKLDRWVDLNRFAIKPALDEVNKLSPFAVEITPVKRGRAVSGVVVQWAKKRPFSPAEQAAAREVNRGKLGRKARLDGSAENVVEGFPASGRIRYSRFERIARDNITGTMPDLEALGAAFVAWAKERSMNLNNAKIEGAFASWCSKRKPLL